MKIKNEEEYNLLFKFFGDYKIKSEKFQNKISKDFNSTLISYSKEEGKK